MRFKIAGLIGTLPLRLPGAPLAAEERTADEAVLRALIRWGG